MTHPSDMHDDSDSTAFINLTDDGERMTCEMPADETVVEVRLKDGSIVRAWYSCNIMEVGDFDFLPVDDDDGEPKFDAGSIADQIVAWRPAIANSESVQP